VIFEFCEVLVWVCVWWSGVFVVGVGFLFGGYRFVQNVYVCI
jgi:hypothetical protein